MCKKYRSTVFMEWPPPSSLFVSSYVFSSSRWERGGWGRERGGEGWSADAGRRLQEIGIQRATHKTKDKRDWRRNVQTNFRKLCFSDSWQSVVEYYLRSTSEQKWLAFELLTVDFWSLTLTNLLIGKSNWQKVIQLIVFTFVGRVHLQLVRPTLNVHCNK